MPKIYHVLETQQFKDRHVLEELFSLADTMRLLDKKNPTPQDLETVKKLKLSQEPRRRVLCSLFYEPSTRTRFSFDIAMQALGGDVIYTESAGHFSSAAKGENLPDTIRVVGGYCDLIVLRHSQEGAAKEAARYSRVPIINAGDGVGQHPTQALLDLYTIKKELGRTDTLKIGMVGDLRNGRTVHSLAYLLAHMKDIKFYFVAPEPVKMRKEIIEYLREKGIQFEETGDLEHVARVVDVLYVTRIQKERFANPAEYEKVKGVYIVNRGIIDIMRADSIIMHPLPRVDEIDPEIDADPRAAYFRQAENGKYIRMALIKMILDSG